MTTAREAILREAAAEAAALRRAGYPDAEVLPEYCIGGEIGPDKIMTKTICVWVGDYRPLPPSRMFLALRRMFGGRDEK